MRLVETRGFKLIVSPCNTDPQYNLFTTPNTGLPSMRSHRFSVLTRSFGHTASALALVMAGLAFAPAGLAQSNETQEINRLISSNQFDQALQKLDAYLIGNPRDAQMRFVRGVVLSALGRTNDAVTAFSRLTEDFPELPEPYNNLAVLYASQGQYDKARAALEMAIRTQPSYATAYDNLGDVYSRLAGQSYEKALQLDGKNESARSKLTMLGSITSLPIGSKQAPRGVKPAAAPTPVAAAPAAKPAPAPAPVAAAPAPVAAKPTPAPAPAAADNSAQEDVLRSVKAWAAAWSRQDMNGYLASYGASFQAPNGMSRKAWEADRRARIEGKGRISVTIEQPVVKLDGDTATVSFRQNYRSDRLDTSSRKTLVLGRAGSRWLIKAERTGG